MPPLFTGELFRYTVQHQNLNLRSVLNADCTSRVDSQASEASYATDHY